MVRLLPALQVVMTLALAKTSGAERRTPAQWLDWVRVETARQKAEESPERKQLLESAGRVMHPHAGGPETLLTARPNRRQQFQPFASWFKEMGAPLFRKWRAGAPLTDADRACEPILQRSAAPATAFSHSTSDCSRTAEPASPRPLAAPLPTRPFPGSTRRFAARPIAMPTPPTPASCSTPSSSPNSSSSCRATRRRPGRHLVPHPAGRPVQRPRPPGARVPRRAVSGTSPWVSFLKENSIAFAALGQPR